MSDEGGSVFTLRGVDGGLFKRLIEAGIEYLQARTAETKQNVYTDTQMDKLHKKRDLGLSGDIASLTAVIAQAEARLAEARARLSQVDNSGHPRPQGKRPPHQQHNRHDKKQCQSSPRQAPLRGPMKGMEKLIADQTPQPVAVAAPVDPVETEATSQVQPTA